MNKNKDNKEDNSENNLIDQRKNEGIKSENIKEKINGIVDDFENDIEEKMEVDQRNKLNDLDSVEWIKLTKSFWVSENPPRDSLKKEHPATFSEKDVKKLILFFTKKKLNDGSRSVVLDPFIGTGSTALAAMELGRKCIGIELIEKWKKIAEKRINKKLRQKKLPGFEEENVEPQIIKGDSRKTLENIDDNSIDFIVTSPPYWSMLDKAEDHKSEQERIDKGLETKYSEEETDLGNISEYDKFLDELDKVWSGCYDVLKEDKYMCIVVSDIRHESKLYMYHSDIANRCEELGFELKGITILIQDDKNLYPYGYPFTYVPNIHHQYIIILQKN